MPKIFIDKGEMNKNRINLSVSGDVKNVAEKGKTLTPAILGMSKSHGAKLSLNMTSEDKKELLVKLEEWRKARKQKLAASILAKHKQTEIPRGSVPLIPSKCKSVPAAGGNGAPKLQDGQSVFERLYKNNGKIKKQEVDSIKQQQIPGTNFRKSVFLPLEKLKKSEKVKFLKKDETETVHAMSESDSDAKMESQPVSFVEMQAQTSDLNSLEATVKPEGEATENCAVNIAEEKSKKEIEFLKPVHTVSAQIKTANLKSFKNGPELGSLQKREVGTQKDKLPLRRSISMKFHQKCRAGNSLRRSISARNLHEINVKAQRAENENFQILQHCDSNTKKETRNEVTAKSVMPSTPKNTKLLTSVHLRNKLEDWLKVNGHSLEGYRHLRCFGINEDSKPSAEAPAVPVDDSLESSCYATAPNTPEVDLEKKNVTPPTVIRLADIKDVEKWLEELHRMIVELKYPAIRCEEWLAAIRKRCTSCSQLPIYWECLAALHESKGDLKCAIEDYERAIIKGGEVDTVGESLAQLFDKMVIEQKKHPQLEKGLDPKNVFKSTIIKFALQQKAIKKLASEMEPTVRQQLYVVTPVRRSTRLQTPIKSSAEIASLQNLTPEVRKNITFKPNELLLSD